MANKNNLDLSARQKKLIAIKFVLFSISAGVIQMASYAILHELTPIDEFTGLDEIFGNEYGLTYFISLFLSVVWNFTFNRKFTFKSAANVPVAMLKVLGYYVVFAPLSIWWTVQLTGIGWNEYLVLLLTMVTNMVTEFLVCRYLVYGKEMFTNEKGQMELKNKD